MKSKTPPQTDFLDFMPTYTVTMNEKGPKVRNNIVYLPEPSGDLAQILEAKRLITRPLRKNWTGNTENHPFRLGETLFQKLI